MTDPLKYPLAQMMTIKKNRFDQAVKLLEEKKLILEKAYEKLYDATKERDEVLHHKQAKLTQIREELDAGTSSAKIQQSKAYITVVDEKLLGKEKRVKAEQKEVDIAQKQVDIATDDLFQKKKDVEKMELHKQEWEKEVRYWAEQKEAVEHDEQGAATHQLRRRANELRRKEEERNL